MMSAVLRERMVRRSSRDDEYFTFASDHHPTRSMAGLPPFQWRDQLATMPSGASICLPNTLAVIGRLRLAEASIE